MVVGDGEGARLGDFCREGQDWLAQRPESCSSRVTESLKPIYLFVYFTLTPSLSKLILG